MTKKRKESKRKKTTKIKVFCAYDKLVEAKSLVPNPRNPSKHSEKQVEKLAILIRFHGWRHPITVSRRSGFIVSGHCRLLAAISLDLGQVPVDYQDFANDAEEWAVLVSDNIVQEFSKFDGQIMADGLVMLDQLNFPVGELTALDKVQIEAFIEGPTYIPDEPEYDGDLETKNKCPKCGYEW